MSADLMVFDKSKAPAEPMERSFLYDLSREALKKAGERKDTSM